jgi:uncharacterized protein YxjI
LKIGQRVESSNEMYKIYNDLDIFVIQVSPKDFENKKRLSIPGGENYEL